ncbi:MAG TPA: YihY/virulence factor BrkB family protein [Terracidiphilus sp.]|jgi:membrane protein|nr:YihY/virulence factor BrkB family protein [Terracidiphilus sp.]
MAKGEATAGGVDQSLNRHEKRIWEMVALTPAKSLWDLRGVSVRYVARRMWNAMLHDRLFSIAAELGFYFLFAVFPMLICASSILGLAARSAAKFYDHLLTYLALVIPTSALGTVVTTFNQTTASSTSGKITFGLIAALWAASTGVSAVQDTMNAVYKIVDRRSFLKAKIQAIGLTILLTCTISLCLASLFLGDFVVAWLHRAMQGRMMGGTSEMVVRVLGWILAAAFLALSFALTYYWAPDLRKRQWHWITPGALLGIAGWLLASVGFRLYLHFFNSYSVTYGSLGAVIILLMWFYITGLMLLIGAEFNSELEAAAMEAKLARESTAGEPLPIAPAA